MKVSHETIRLAVELGYKDYISLALQPLRVSPGEERLFSLLFAPDPSVEFDDGSRPVTKLLVQNITRKQLSDLAQDILRSLS